LFCTVVFLISWFYLASLTFLIYTLLTFDQKKKKERALSQSVSQRENLERDALLPYGDDSAAACTDEC
jgi:hypothetical protein